MGLLSDVERYARIPDPKYPRMGEPLAAVVRVSPKGKMIHGFMGHVETSKSTGIFVEMLVDSESEAREESANFVVEMRTKSKTSGKF